MARRNRLPLLLALILLCCVGGFQLLTGDPRDESRDRAPERGESAPEEGVEAPGPPPGEPAPADEPSPPGEAAETGGAAGEGSDAPASGTEDETPFSYDDETPYSVRVRVFDPAGEPAECKVEIVVPRYDWSFGALPTQERGVFRGHLPEPGSYAARADWGGTRTSVDFEVTDGAPEASVDLRFEGTGSVSGTVFTASGDVEEGARGEQRVIGQTELAVELIPDPGPDGEPVPLRSAPVTDRGDYRIAGVPAGKYIVRIKGKYHASLVTVGEGAHVTHDILLGGGRIFGRVTDRASGEPLSAVQVVLQLSRAGTVAGDLAKRAGFPSLSDRLRPTANGDYEFRHLPLGEYRLFSNGEEHAPGHGSVTLTESAPEARLDFALDRGSAVDISITDLEGNPVETPLWSVAGIRCGFVGHVVGLRAGTFELAAFGIGYEIQFREGVVFKPGEATALEFRLAPEVRTVLEFQSPDGELLEGVRVSLLKGGRNLTPHLESFLREYNLPLRTTNEAGHVVVRGVREGPVRVVAKRTGYALFDETIALKAGTDAIRVELEPADTTFTWRVRVTRVNPGSPAAAIGLRPGDVIVSYAGIEIDSLGALPQAIAAAKAAGSATVEMTVERDGTRFSVDVVPGVLGVILEEFEVEHR